MTPQTITAWCAVRAREDPGSHPGLACRTARSLRPRAVFNAVVSAHRHAAGPPFRCRRPTRADTLESAKLGYASTRTGLLSVWWARRKPQSAEVASGAVTGIASLARTDRVAERRRAVALARHFREAEGLSVAQIADRLGRSPATIKAYFYDPTGEKARAVKARYVGVCRGCGAYTQPRNGKGDAYAYCKACHPGAIERRWTARRGPSHRIASLSASITTPSRCAPRSDALPSGLPLRPPQRCFALWLSTDGGASVLRRSTQTLGPNVGSARCQA